MDGIVADSVIKNSGLLLPPDVLPWSRANIRGRSDRLRIKVSHGSSLLFAVPKRVRHPTIAPRSSRLTHRLFVGIPNPFPSQAHHRFQPSFPLRAHLCFLRGFLFTIVRALFTIIHALFTIIHALPRYSTLFSYPPPPFSPPITMPLTRSSMLNADERAAAYAFRRQRRNWVLVQYMGNTRGSEHG